MDFLSLVLKKILSVLVLPLALGIFFALLGLVIAAFTRWRKSGLILIAAGIALPTIFSLGIISQKLLLPLETHYPPLAQIPSQVDTVVVLGGGNGSEGHYPANTRLGSSSLSRLVEGIRLYRQLQYQNPNARLILSGGRIFRSIPESGRMRNTAVILGVNPQRIFIENGSQNTYQEASYLKQLLGVHPFILVTSAYHMPRAIATFTAQGMNPIPAPTQFMTLMRWDPVKNYIPNSSALMASDIALHEYLGVLWNKISSHNPAVKFS